jgi:hypothetical protein
MNDKQKSLLAKFQRVAKDYENAKNIDDQEGMNKAQAEATAMTKELREANFPFPVNLVPNQNNTHFKP